MSNTAPEQETGKPAGLIELERHVTTGLWDQIHLAARYAVQRTADMLEAATTFWREENMTTRIIENTVRKNDTLKGLGQWAVEKGMVPDGPIEPRLPQYQRLI